MLQAKNLRLVCVILSLFISLSSLATTYYVATDGDDSNTGGINDPFLTIKKGTNEANGGTAGNYDIVHVNSGTYITEPIIIENDNMKISFEPDVEICARSRFDPNDSNDPDDPNSFRNPESCLFSATNRSDIIFDGDNTVFNMRKSEYPESFYFEPVNDIDYSTDQITNPNHGLIVGDKMKYYRCSNNVVGGLTSEHWYYIIVVDSSTIKLAESFADANNGIGINLYDNSTTGTHFLSRVNIHHVIRIFDCNNIEIKNLTAQNSGADGIWVGGVDASCNVNINDVNCDENSRTAIAVTSVDGLTIENCILQNTGPYLTGAGIDFEPGRSYQKLKNIVMRNTIIKDNDYQGIIIAPKNLDDNNTIDMLFENMTVQSVFINNMYNYSPESSIKFKNITTEETHLGVRIFKSYQAGTLTFENCLWKDIDSNYGWYGDIYPIHIFDYWDGSSCENPGGVEFVNCQVIDDINRPAILYTNNNNEPLHEIHGNLYVMNPNCSGDLYEWNGATLYNVSLTCHSGMASWVDNLAYFTMDDNTNNTIVQDSSVNSLDGTFHDSDGDPNTEAHHVGGIIGGALDFDGVNDYVEILSDDFSFGEEDFTLSAWVKTTDANGPILSEYESSTEGMKFDISYSKLRFILWESGKTVCRSTYNINDGQWHFVTYTRENGTGQLYIDGVSNGDPQDHDYDIEASKFRIGGDGACPYYLDGTIDEVSIYNRALSADEVEQFHKQGLKAWLYYNVDDNTNNTIVQDSSVNSLDGTFHDSDGDPNTEAHHVGGIIGGALDFDGVNDYVEILSDDFSFGEEDFTLSAWVKTTDTHGPIFSEYNNPYGMKFMLSYGLLKFSIYGTDKTDCQSTYTINNGQWHFVTYTRENGTGQLYIDGVSNGDSQDHDHDIEAIKIRIGGDIAYPYYLDGAIDEGCIYNRALSADEIKTIVQ